MTRIYPQFDRDVAFEELAALENLLRAGMAPRPLADGMLHPATKFNGFGGVPVDVPRLRALRSALESALSGAGAQGRDADRRFDVAVGQVLAHWFEEDGRGQASNPEIWPYLTIYVLPDLAIRRFGPDKSGRLPRDRYLSGRRNVFYRAYLRSWILGDLLDDPDLPLYEDDLVGLVDRNLSADHRIARMIGEQIRSIQSGEARREGVRGGLKSVQYELRVSDLASLTDESAKRVIAECFDGGVKRQGATF
ncbi:hypothetical protein BF93_11980 [Brachybacterium phenoliresistens]|uniref:Uncharacterized protein n=1 Tax=Brachybacterium phenoliresistens TaxID=396014 RepID=Z9JVR8_9MICO|nr:hypothetical protein [Brachybacterium phenoliresistens]EWS82470.1 hypothetical protein BF93_11980 [Brachybacterium phenoliresistens]